MTGLVLAMVRMTTIFKDPVPVMAKTTTTAVITVPAVTASTDLPKTTITVKTAITDPKKTLLTINHKNPPTEVKVTTRLTPITATIPNHMAAKLLPLTAIRMIKFMGIMQHHKSLKNCLSNHPTLAPTKVTDPPAQTKIGQTKLIKTMSRKTTKVTKTATATKDLGLNLQDQIVISDQIRT